MLGIIRRIRTTGAMRNNAATSAGAEAPNLAVEPLREGLGSVEDAQIGAITLDHADERAAPARLRSG
jgi:hypothetical protein